MQHCVRGRGRVPAHVSVAEGELPEVGVDETYMGLEGSQVTILVCKCKRTGCLAATQVPNKGMNADALPFFAGWLRGLGWKPLLLRPDNARALQGFSPCCSRGARTRVLKSHLEERLQRQLDWSEPLATRLVRHSANCLSKYRIQADGKTPDQRLTGKRWRRQAVEFGEKAAFLLVAARRERRVAGDAERMMDGIFVGHHERTGASLFLSERGLLGGTRVQRKTADQRWDNEFIRKCLGVPRMLIGEEPEVRPPPVHAAVMRAP